MNCKSALLAIAAVALLSAPAVAADTTTAKVKHVIAKLSPFEKADTNKDGSISKEEFAADKALKKKSFETYDTNADGSVSADEWKAQDAAPAAKPAAK